MAKWPQEVIKQHLLKNRMLTQKKLNKLFEVREHAYKPLRCSSNYALTLGSDGLLSCHEMGFTVPAEYLRMCT